jgi:hypothetical protein
MTNEHSSYIQFFPVHFTGNQIENRPASAAIETQYNDHFVDWSLLASAPKRDALMDIATSRAFSSVIIAEHSDWYEIKMKCRDMYWIISQCKHIQMKLSYPSINRALRVFFINHFVVHSGLLCVLLLYL